MHPSQLSYKTYQTPLFSVQSHAFSKFDKKSKDPFDINLGRSTINKEENPIMSKLTGFFKKTFSDVTKMAES